VCVCVCVCHDSTGFCEWAVYERDVYACVCVCQCVHDQNLYLDTQYTSLQDVAVKSEGVTATSCISRLLKTTGLFCKRVLENRQYSAKKTYNFKEPNTIHVLARRGCHIRRCVYAKTNLTRGNDLYDWYECTKSLLWHVRIVGPLKLQVSFAKEPYKRDCIVHHSYDDRNASSLCFDMCVSCDEWYECTWIWLMYIGSFKLQVSFAKEPYKRDCILHHSYDECIKSLLWHVRIVRWMIWMHMNMTDVNRLLKTAGLFCKRAPQKRLCSACWSY